MSDMTQNQIRREFERQVRLCSGLGREEMLRAVNAHFDAQPRKHQWQFYMNGTFCTRCGCSIGDPEECKQ